MVEKESDEIIGSAIAHSRKRAGMRQDHVAQAACVYGFDWTQGTVTAIETGRRAISWREGFFLQGLFNVGAADLLQGPDGRIAAGYSEADLSQIRRDYPAPAPKGDWAKRKVGRGEISRARSEEELAIVASYSPRMNEGRLAQILLSSGGVAEKRAAEALDRSAFEVSVAAWSLWGRSLSDERDRLSRKRKVSSAAAKGHITKQLRRELGAFMEWRRP